MIVPFQPHSTADKVGGSVFLAAFAVIAFFGGRRLTMMVRILRHPERFPRKTRENYFDRRHFAHLNQGGEPS